MACGAPLDYSNEEREVACVFCEKRFVSSVVCEAGHFICDACHSADGFEVIEKGCTAGSETDMISMLQRIRQHPAIPLHGPEHHALVPGVILATYRNLGGELSEEKILTGIRRGAKFPGGGCGFMGTCGAAVGVGIAFSVMLESTPVTPAKRSTVLGVTSKVLAEISNNEAARCCQRECFIALEKAAELLAGLLPVTLQADSRIVCDQIDLNDECLGPECPLYDFGTDRPASSTQPPPTG